MGAAKREAPVSQSFKFRVSGFEWVEHCFSSAFKPEYHDPALAAEANISPHGSEYLGG